MGLNSLYTAGSALMATLAGFYFALALEDFPETFFRAFGLIGMVFGTYAIRGGLRSCESDYGMGAIAIGGLAFMLGLLLLLATMGSSIL